MKSTPSGFYGKYDQHLSQLIAHKSVFTDDHGIAAALRYCSQAIQDSYDDRHTYFDAAGNLISVSNNFDRSRNAVYLSAHIDTVDADPAEWVSSSNPFAPEQTASHIIGRGANDCKAGVALMLFFSNIARQLNLSLDNVILLISYREEGNREKTSTNIGKSLGSAIPVSDRENLMLCLENTISIVPGYSIGIYDSEPCNIFIEVTATIPEMRDFLKANPKWKPVYVNPLEGAPRDAPSLSDAGTSGHTATVPNTDNVIYNAIINRNHSALSGGDYVQTSVIDNRVRIFEQPRDALHKVVLNFRDLAAAADIKPAIEHLKYRERYPFAHAEGSDRRLQLENSFAKQLARQMLADGMRPQFMSNPGRSDASAIWNATSLKDRLHILTMGPGTRSHDDRGVARKTHGPDEGFHRDSGYLAIQFISTLVQRFLAGEAS
jgi:acetylornithine deacetylase/succinyl-diaminopimelate desuccinylase-like protein